MKKIVAKTASYGRIGTGASGSDGVPIEDEGIGTRISAVADLLGTRKTAASAAGVSVDSLQRYIRGENMPPLDVAARLCEQAGARIEWLATGIGDIQAKEAPASQAVRPETLTIAIQLAAEALQGKYLPPPKYAELVALIYELLEDGLPEAKILRFARAAGPGE